MSSLGSVTVRLLDDAQYQQAHDGGRLPPGVRPAEVPRERAVDWVSFDGEGTAAGQSLRLQGYQGQGQNGLEANTIVRFAERGWVWLSQETTWQSLWNKNAVSVDDGRCADPLPSVCELNAIGDFPTAGFSATTLADHHGATWQRNVLWRKGAYFLVIDRLATHRAADYHLTCTWRTPRPARWEEGAWRSQVGEETFVLKNSEALRQRCERGPQDQGERAFLLRQEKYLPAVAGEISTFQNLFYVTGPGHEQEYELRRLREEAVLIRGPSRSLTTAPSNLPFSPPLTFAGIGRPGRGVQVGPLGVAAALFLASADELSLARATSLRLPDGTWLRAVNPVDLYLQRVAETNWRGRVTVHERNLLEIEWPGLTGATWDGQPVALARFEQFHLIVEEPGEYEWQLETTDDGAYLRQVLGELWDRAGVTG